MTKPRRCLPWNDQILLNTPDLDEITRFAESLNTEFFWLPVPWDDGWAKVRADLRPFQTQLRRLTQQWLDCDRHVDKLLAMDSHLAREASNFRAQLVSWKDGSPRLLYSTLPEKWQDRSPLISAVGIFISFLLNPYASHLFGPCPNCDKYFVQRSRRQTVYCSKECGLRHTAKQSLQRNRRDEQEQKLQRAKNALIRWGRTKTTKDWKTWISERTHISKNWLTRVERSGALECPIDKSSIRQPSSAATPRALPASSGTERLRYRP